MFSNAGTGRPLGGRHRRRPPLRRRWVPGLAQPRGNSRVGYPPRISPPPVRPLEKADQQTERIPRKRFSSAQRLRHARLRIHPVVPERRAPPIPRPRPAEGLESIVPGRTRPLVQPGVGRRERCAAAPDRRPDRSFPSGDTGTTRSHVLGRGRHRPRPVRGYGDHPLGRVPARKKLGGGRVGPPGVPDPGPRGPPEKGPHLGRSERVYSSGFVAGSGNFATGGSRGARWSISSSSAVRR